MNVVLETLFLRRPRIEYISPPVCPVNFSASGVAFIEQTFDQSGLCPMSVVGLDNDFLNFPEPADGLSYNVYSASAATGPFDLLVDGLLPNYAAVYTAGIFWTTANTSSGETAPSTSTVSPGGVYTKLPVKQESGATSYNLYKDGSKVVSGFSGMVVEGNFGGWYQATKITADGESSLADCSPVFINLPGPPPPPPPPPGPDWTVFGSELFAWKYYTGDFGGTFPPVPSWGISGGFDKSGFAQLVANEPFQSAGWDGAWDMVYTGPAAHVRMTITTSVGNYAIWGFWLGPSVLSSGGAYISSPGQTGAVIIQTGPSGTYTQDFSIPENAGYMVLRISGSTGPWAGGSGGFTSLFSFNINFENIP